MSSKNIYQKLSNLLGKNIVNKKYLIWMNCYGGWDPSLRSEIETAGYSQYLDAFVDKVFLIEDQIGAIYISGGMHDSLGRTECETTKPELEKRFGAKGLNIEINVDEESVTSQMVLVKFLETWQKKCSEMQPLLFVDENRYETNLFVFKYYVLKMKLGLVAEEVIIPLPRADDHPHSTKEFQAKKIEKMKELGVEEVGRLEIEARRNS